MKLSFGSAQLCKCLEALGFQLQKSVGSSHVKYKLPSGKKIAVGIRPFMIIQLGRKTYDPHSQSRYIKEIMNLGFSREEIEEVLQGKK